MGIRYNIVPTKVNLEEIEEIQKLHEEVEDIVEDVKENIDNIKESNNDHSK